MNKLTTQNILRKLNLEIVKIRENAEKTDEATKERLTGWSASGDKYHAQAAADLTKGYLKRLELLKKELEEAPTEIPKTIKPPCMVKVEYSDGGVAELILVKNAVSFSGTSFISIDSPLGKAVLDKSLGDTFSYNSAGGNIYSAKIVAIV